MSKYSQLWKYVSETGMDSLKLSFTEIENIVGVAVDHSFLNFKKELTDYGYQVGKISMKEKTVIFEKCEIQNDIIARLKDKDDKLAYEYAKKIEKESEESDKYLSMIPEFAEMLTDKSSYIRTRGFCLICNQARWADNNQIENVFNNMSELLYDDKPTVIRQCLKALHEVVLYRPEMSERIVQAINKIDLSRYKDSMSPLIEKDIRELMKVMEKSHEQNQIQA